MSEYKKDHSPHLLASEEGLPVVGIKPDQTEAERQAEQSRQTKRDDLTAKNVQLTERNAKLTRWLVCFTFVGSCIGIWQACNSQTSATAAKNAVTVAENTLKDTQAARKISDAATKAALDATIDQFQKENRGYLSIENPIQTGRDPKWKSVTVPVINYGHVPTAVKEIKFRYDRLPSRIADTEHTLVPLESRSISIRSSEIIAPGPSGFKLTLEAPTYSPESSTALTLATQHILIDGRVLYDTGFGQVDSIRFCLYYQNPTDGWHSCSGSYIQIDIESGKQTTPIPRYVK